MATRGTVDDVVTSNAAPVNPTTTAAPGYNTPPTNSDLYGFLNRYSANQALGPEIEKYMELLKQHLPKDVTPAITIRRLSEPAGAHVVIAGNAAIILLFDAVLSKDVQNFLPTSDYGAHVARALNNEIKPTPNLLNIILIQPEDYIRVQQMAQHLWFNLTFANDGTSNGVDISLFSKNEFVVDVNPETARNFIGQRYPHAVMPRIDIGFTLFAKTPRRQGGGFTNYLDESRPIAALGAYVEIWQPNETNSLQQGPKYAATVHITNITSDLPFSGIIPFLFAIAADRFLDRGGWKQPFSSFRKGLPNLGQLSLDPSNKGNLWFANTPDELNTWIHANMLPRPFLAVDVVEGQARIPALAVYGDAQTYSNKVYEHIQSFFGANLPINRSIPPYITLPVPAFIGHYGDPRGKLEDSREVDYLNLLAKTGTQDPSSRFLLQYNADPTVRARLIHEKTGGTFKSSHRVHISFLDPNLLGVLAQDIVNKVKILGGNETDRIISTPWLDAMQKAYLNTQFNTATAWAQPGAGYGQTRYGIVY